MDTTLNLNATHKRDKQWQHHNCINAINKTTVKPVK